MFWPTRLIGLFIWIQNFDLYRRKKIVKNPFNLFSFDKLRRAHLTTNRKIYDKKTCKFEVPKENPHYQKTKHRKKKDNSSRQAETGPSAKKVSTFLAENILDKEI